MSGERVLINYKSDKQIVESAPKMAVTYCMYGYGDAMQGTYLNCEDQFWDDDKEEMRWVDMDLVDDLFHSHRCIDDIKKILKLEENTK